MKLPSQGARIRDQENERVYVLGELFKAGHFSVIYKLIPTMPGSATVSGETEWVAKIGRVENPTPDSEQELRKRFQEEYERIQAIRSASSGRFVPEAHWGEVMDADAHEGSPPILIMPFLKREWHLPSQISHFIENNIEASLWRKYILNAEQHAVDAGMQYLELLEILHQQVGITCRDRKVGDLFWDTDLRRLLVLDWNVAHENNPSNQARDYRIFGALWYELLVGHAPPALKLKDVDDTEREARWGLLTRGTRRLLVQSVNYGQRDGFDSPQAIQRAWETHKKRLRMSIAELVQEGQRLTQSVSAPR